MAQKLLLFWRKPARRCWWEGVELHDVEGVPGKLKVWIRRVWTLEMVSLPICVAMNANANNLTERDRAQMSARAGSLVFGPHRTKALYLSTFFLCPNIEVSFTYWAFKRNGGIAVQQHKPGIFADKGDVRIKHMFIRFTDGCYMLFAEIPGKFPCIYISFLCMIITDSFLEQSGAKGQVVLYGIP